MNRDGKGMVIIYLIVGPICALLSLVVLLQTGYSIFLAVGLAWLLGCAATVLVVAFFGLILRGVRRIHSSATSSELSE